MLCSQGCLFLLDIHPRKGKKKKETYKKPTTNNNNKQQQKPHSKPALYQVAESDEEGTHNRYIFSFDLEHMVLMSAEAGAEEKEGTRTKQVPL